MGSLGDLEGPLQQRDLSLGVVLTQALQDRLKGHVDAVSYTHLDVYKRQPVDVVDALDLEDAGDDVVEVPRVAHLEGEPRSGDPVAGRLN